VSALKKLNWELPAAIVATLIVAGPLLIGRGIDVPDDALYHTVASWEWLHYAWTQGLNPHFVPGKLGGIPLATDVVPMGPAYPGSWLLFFLPVWLALPVVVVLHMVGILLAVRWFAQTFGAGHRAATLAGAAVAAGPLAAVSVIDCHIDVMPIYLWFPIALGATERFCSASSGTDRRRWALLCGAALALMLLGSHVRFSAAAAAAWGLWALIRGMNFRWIVGASLIAVCGGSPGFVPNILAIQEASSGLNRMVALSGPVHEVYNGWNLTGWLVPKPYWRNRDFSPGTLLGLCFILTLPTTRGQLRRLALFTLVLLGAAVSPSIPGLRYLFAPLLLLSHPLDLIYGTLALFPGVVVAARGLEGLVAKGPRVLLSKRRGGLLVVLAFLIASRALMPESNFGDATEFRDWAVGLGQAMVVLSLAFLILKRSALRSSVPTLLFLLVLADLVVLGCRYHLAVPSGNLDLVERARGDDLEVLRPSYVDLTDLAKLDGFLYDEEQAREAPDESQREAASWVEASLRDRRWPLHIGPGHGIPALSGRVKMPSVRTMQNLLPLADALVRKEGDRRILLEREDPDQVTALFQPEALGGRILRLTDTHVAVSSTAVVADIDRPLPPCWVPSEVVSLEGSPSEAQRAAWTQVVEKGVNPLQTSFLEDSEPRFSGANNAQVYCEDDQVEVFAPAGALIVVRRPWHSGWQVRDEAGKNSPLLPANAFHSAFVAPPGKQTFTIHFVPPGLRESQLAASFAWLLVFVGYFGTRRSLKD